MLDDKTTFFRFMIAAAVVSGAIVALQEPAFWIAIGLGRLVGYP